MNYILYGEQYPMIHKRLLKILNEVLGKPDDFNVVKLDYLENQIEEIISECTMLPLGYDKKVVVVDNSTFLCKDGNKEVQEKFIEILKNCADEISIILILRSSKIDSKSEIFNEVNEKGRIFDFVDIKKEEWPLYAKKYFNDRNIKIDNDAIEELVRRIDGDLQKFINEADKLCLYKEEINLSDVLLMVSKPLEDDAFQIANALFKGDNSLAISIYRDLKLVNYKNGDIVIGLLASQFRFVSQVAYLDSQGMSQSQIASELGVNDVRVKIALKNCRYLSKIQIEHAIDDLYYLDYQTKSGLIDRSYGFELFLINFPN